MMADLPLLPVLREEIQAQGGRITFARFMELCLYHPQHGYYNSERVKLGRQGDFFTSMHMGPVFARLLARHFEQAWTALGRPARFDLVEMGPGDGHFARELLPWIAFRFPDFSAALHYTAVEQSPLLRARLRQHLEEFRARVRVQEDLLEDAPGITGCIIANEFFDALPVHILAWREGRWRERFVCLNGAGLGWCDEAPSAPELVTEAEKRLDPAIPAGAREPGWQAEISPAAAKWAARLLRAIQRGELLVVDYGYTLDEWRAGRFRQGSAMAYREHRAVEDLLASPGEQDLTAHVNFDLFLEALSPEPGADVRIRTQSKFLLDIGEPDQLADVFAGCATESERLQRAGQLKTLILPEGMGHTFQALQIRKGM